MAPGTYGRTLRPGRQECKAGRHDLLVRDRRLKQFLFGPEVTDFALRAKICSKSVYPFPENSVLSTSDCKSGRSRRTMKASYAPGGGRQRAGNLLMVCGVALLGSFFLFKGWSANQSSAGLDAFEAARVAHVKQRASETYPIRRTHTVNRRAGYTESSLSQSGAAGPTPDRLEATALTDIPDTRLWSDKRVAEFEATRAAGGEAPRAVLRIDHLDINVPVYNGADEFNLNRGVARIIGTGRVGEVGNLGIAGHRDSFFRPLKDIEVGDTLELETFDGTEAYRVSSIEIVDPTALHVLGPSNTRTVTLVTCYPFYYVGNAPQRFIVKAEALNNQVNS